MDDTSDDPVTMSTIVYPALIAGGIGVGVTALTGGFKKAKSASAASATAPGQATKTAEPVEALSEQATKNRRLAASALTRRFAEPTLGIPALTGV